MHCVLASYLAVLSFTPAFAGAWEVGNAVKIADGTTIQGHASSWHPAVSEYLGIPFAQPPIGDLRWKAPEPFKANGTIVASKYSPDCPANIRVTVNKTTINSPKGIVYASMSQHGSSFDEDCLTLNVWTKPQSGDKAKAVLVWFYGGGFTLGNSANPAYNGARLAEEQDIIVVSMNYRINIFGFPGVPGLADQNLGFLDQRLAVEWVRDNIGAFGGDPKRITLTGESAGGASVDVYSYAWTKDPIANAFISQSGTAFLVDILGGSLNKSVGWFKASQRAGCGGAADVTPEASLRCMRGKSWKDVLAAIKSEGTAAALGGMGEYGPMVDGKIVFKDYSARAKAGNFIKRPMLVGNNANEVSLFAVILGITSNLGSSLFTTAASVFGCPAGTSAKARADQGVKSWRYLYAGEWPNQNIASGAGAFHSAEISMVFGSLAFQHRHYSQITDQSISFPDTPEQIKLSKTMMTAWSAFVKDPEKGLEKFGWPAYDSTKPTIIKLGGPNSSDVVFAQPSTIDSSCGLFDMVSGLLAYIIGMV